MGDQWINDLRTKRKGGEPFLVLCGPCGSGKSTLARNIFEKEGYIVKTISPYDFETKQMFNDKCRELLFSTRCRIGLIWEDFNEKEHQFDLKLRYTDGANPLIITTQRWTGKQGYVVNVMSPCTKELMRKAKSGWDEKVIDELLSRSVRDLRIFNNNLEMIWKQKYPKYKIPKGGILRSKRVIDEEWLNSKETWKNIKDRFYITYQQIYKAIVKDERKGEEWQELINQANEDRSQISYAFYENIWLHKDPSQSGDLEKLKSLLRGLFATQKIDIRSSKIMTDENHLVDNTMLQFIWECAKLAGHPKEIGMRTNSLGNRSKNGGEVFKKHVNLLKKFGISSPSGIKHISEITIENVLKEKMSMTQRKFWEEFKEKNEHLMTYLRKNGYTMIELEEMFNIFVIDGMKSRYSGTRKKLVQEMLEGR